MKIIIMCSQYYVKCYHLRRTHVVVKMISCCSCCCGYMYVLC
ncbi:hypothetical protein KSS87_003660 [Heliosperma pusillum]|nr:hypothetical protein KSS87_003660 [Heliosperma pusillum]